MTNQFRLNNPGRVNPDKLISFSFDGKNYYGYEGDTLASALMANGVRIVGRSFKYHRPRGIFSAGAEEPNAIVQIGQAPYEEPNVLATTVNIFDGMMARSVNTWPNAAHDLLAIFGLAKPFFVSGFYYKVFKWPSWKFWSPMVRWMAGLGTIPKMSDPDDYDYSHAHTDILIVGAGPAGLAAALANARSGKRVMLVDQNAELGGSLLYEREEMGGRPALEWVVDTEQHLRALDNVTILTRATASGYYDHNMITVSERMSNHEVHQPRERFWHIRAGLVILATGAIERPLVFPDNDRPGVMLASAIRHYVNRYGVTPGRRVLIATNNDNAYRTALDLHETGVHVVGIVDARPDPEGDLVKAVRDLSITIYDGHVVTGTKGRRGVRSATIASIDLEKNILAEHSQTIICDVVATSGGWSPVVHLHSQSGGKLRFDETTQSFVPREYVQDNICIGAASGTFDLAGCLAAGAGEADIDLPKVKIIKTEPLVPLWDLPTNLRKIRHAKRWVDLLHDVTASDVILAARENYVSVEHFKRYTTTGMAMDQGKTSNVNALAILGQATDRAIQEVGTTKFRPPYTPVTMGAMAARSTGKLFHPLRHLPLHVWHQENRAQMENYGGWFRPASYCQTGESEHDAVMREVLAVRSSVGILDYSSLGKIDVRGPDAAEFLNRFYVNNVKTLKVGRARYGLMLNEHGTIMDDGVFARLADDHFWVTTTSGGAAHFVGWLEEWRQCEWPDMDVIITSLTTGWGTISLQGSKARALLLRLETDIDLSKEGFPHMAVRTGTIEGVPTRILRTSFTGELGFEVNVPVSYMTALWQRLMAVGTDLDITPFGIEALMVMRTEKGFIHVGVDTDSSSIPDDVGFGPVARKKTDDYVGKRSLFRPDAIRDDREGLVGLKVMGDKPLRMGSIILASGYETAPAPMQGRVTSSYMSPTIGSPVALGVIKGGGRRLGEIVKIYDVDGTTQAEIVAPCFYDQKGERLHV
ncbi:MAG: sarcosine oxidase subunit alpha [Alphaproteobacteria bacterium]|nr:MAG: sarcosine oxidase subunit alpha [Alphaproteobacteria bacterium]